MRTLRRQNVSCDTCRHAKRRCPAQSGASRHPPAACSRCLRLDLPCTWRFVTAHATAKLLVETSTCGSDGNPGRDGGTDRTQISSKLNGSGCPSSPQREVSDTRAPQVELSTVNSHDLAADADTDRGQPKEYPTRRPDLRISVNTSLDRAFASSVLVEKQSAHHQQVLSWCKDRFLAQQSNPFRPTGGYLLIPEALDEARPDQAAAVFADPVYRLTMFQVARLLDEFAELYGNPLKTRHLRDAQKAQEAVLQAWSMQWFVAREASRREGSAPEDQHRRTCSDDMLESMRHRDMYSAYWWRAHRMLADSKGSSSFTRILAVFMFHTAAVPDGAASQLSLGDTPFDLLTRALLQMQALLRLLHVFTDRLPSSSRYRSLLECAASIVHWYGYMRDTSASMLSARTPTLPQALISDEAVLEDSDGKVARVQRGDNTTAADIEAAHHRLASKTIILWREVVHLRDLCSDGSLDPISTVAALSSCLSSAAASESNVRDLELGLSDRVPVRRASVAACSKSSLLTLLCPIIESSRSSHTTLLELRCLGDRSAGTSDPIIKFLRRGRRVAICRQSHRVRRCPLNVNCCRQVRPRRRGRRRRHSTCSSKQQPAFGRADSDGLHRSCSRTLYRRTWQQ